MEYFYPRKKAAFSSPLLSASCSLQIHPKVPFFSFNQGWDRDSIYYSRVSSLATRCLRVLLRWPEKADEIWSSLFNWLLEKVLQVLEIRGILRINRSTTNDLIFFQSLFQRNSKKGWNFKKRYHILNPSSFSCRVTIEPNFIITFYNFHENSSILVHLEQRKREKNPVKRSRWYWADEKRKGLRSFDPLPDFWQHDRFASYSRRRFRRVTGIGDHVAGITFLRPTLFSNRGERARSALFATFSPIRSRSPSSCRDGHRSCSPGRTTFFETRWNYRWKFVVVWNL